MITFVYPLIQILSLKKLQYLEQFINKNYTYMVRGFTTTHYFIGFLENTLKLHFTGRYFLA